MPHSPSAAGFIRNQLLDSTGSAGVTDQHWCDGIKHKSPRICRGKKKGKYWYFTKMTRDPGLIFCGPVEVLLLVLLKFIYYSFRFTSHCDPLRLWFILCSRLCIWSQFGHILGSTWQGWHTFWKLGESWSFIPISNVLDWQKVTKTRSPSPFCCCRQFLCF